MTFHIGSRRDDDEAKSALSGAALPVRVADLFIANLAALSAVEDLGGIPSTAVVGADLFGSNLLARIKTARTGWGTKAQFFGVIKTTGPFTQNA